MGITGVFEVAKDPNAGTVEIKAVKKPLKKVEVSKE